MQPHQFVQDMTWKALCNDEAEAFARYSDAIGRGDVAAIAAAQEKLQRANDAVWAREEYLRGVDWGY